jgi:hypothetical protein
VRVAPARRQLPCVASEPAPRQLLCVASEAARRQVAALPEQTVGADGAWEVAVLGSSPRGDTPAGCRLGALP